MAKLQRARIDASHGGQDMKAGSGTQLVGKGCMVAHRAVAQPRAEAGLCAEIKEVARCVGEAVEVISDGKVLDNIALPGIDHTPIGLQPRNHSSLLAVGRLIGGGHVVSVSFGIRYRSSGSSQPLKFGLRFSEKAARDSIRSRLSPCSCSLAASALWEGGGSGRIWRIM